MSIAEIRNKLSGVWQKAITVQGVGLFVSLTLLSVGWYAAFSIAQIQKTFAQPYAILTTLFLCLADLLLRSPIRAGQFAFYREVCVGNDPPATFILAGFHKPFYRKTVQLRMKLWCKRIVYSFFVFILPAILLAIGKYLKVLSGQSTAVELTYLLCCLFAAIFFVVGLLWVELAMICYMPAWHLLPDCKSVKDALKSAKKLTKGRMGELVWLYSRFLGWKILFLLFLPYFYAAPLLAVARADWIEKNRLSK